MRRTIAILVALFATTVVSAQSAFYGPFTDTEAQLLSAVWPEIRAAERYEDIYWPAHGLARAPGSRGVQQMMSLNWRELRLARRFEQIEWDDVIDGRDTESRSRRFEDQTDRFEQRFPGSFTDSGVTYADIAGPFTDDGPFTRDEAAAMSEVWPQIREAAAFGDINWQAHGFARAPGDSDARMLLATHWNEARRARRFEDIRWNEIIDESELRTSGLRASESRTSRERQYAGGFGGGGWANPFTPEESEIMSEIWSRIRYTDTFEDVNWRRVGLSGPPGSLEARRLMATHWDEFREEARFEDINWSATTGPRRVLR